MLIKPAREGLKVLDPVTFQPLPPEGREVPDHDTYWLRRMYDGDVTKVELKATTETKKKGGAE